MNELRYKLLDEDNTSYRGHEWKNDDKWHHASGNPDQLLCTDGWLHCYETPELALLHNPIHANVKHPRLWVVEVAGNCLRDHQLKCGYRHMRLVCELVPQAVTTAQCVRYAHEVANAARIATASTCAPSDAVSYAAAYAVAAAKSAAAAAEDAANAARIATASTCAPSDAVAYAAAYAAAAAGDAADAAEDAAAAGVTILDVLARDALRIRE